MSDLRTRDAWARERALEVGRSFIVQAPAGAGKTELLTRRFLALLATVAEPESILAITFTRKAAAEMRDRILGALRAVHAPDPERPLHERTLQLARAALAADAARGWQLLAQPGRLRIQTIDALNLGLARRLPLLSGLGAGLGIEEDARDLYARAAENLLAQLPHGSPQASQAVAILLAHLDNRVERFIELVIEMLTRREAWLPILPDDAQDEVAAARLRHGLESARERLVLGHLESLQRALPSGVVREAAAVAHAAARNLLAAGKESPICACAQSPQPPDATSDSIGVWQGLAQLFLKADGEVRAAFNAGVGVPPGPAGQELKRRAKLLADELGTHGEAVALLDAVRSLPPLAYDALEWRVLLAQFRVLRLAVAELELVFAGQRAADYPRFAWAARQSLGTADAPTDTALALDAELRHVLVDEFQDTSEAQVGLLAALTAGWQRDDGRTLFLVGDPMQSIYRFRNAEVGLFLDIRDRGLGDQLEIEPLTLAVNFRSTVPVVQWVNECFGRVLPPTDDVLRGAVSYAASVARADAGTDGGVRVHALLRRSRLYEAQQVASIVHDRLAAEPKARIGILVQGRSHLVHIVAELARRGIACRATDIDPLGARPVVLDLLALTRALSHLADRPAWLAVLRAPWCGLTLAELHALVADDREATMVELLRDPARRARLDGAARASLERTWGILDAALGELPRFGIRDTVERAWNALGGAGTVGGERELDEAEAYFGTLAELETRQAGPADLARLGRALEALYAPSREHPDVRVELLTVHKAKGLQYDTVIVPALERMPGRNAKRLLHWLKLPHADRNDIVVAPVARTGDDPNPLYAWLESLEQEKLLQERRRLLYVAATRAERWLHLFGSAQVQETDAGPVVRRPTGRSALGLLWPAVAYEFDARLAELGEVAGETAPQPVRDPPLRRLPAAWDASVVPRAPRIVSRAVPRLAADPGVEFDWATETARHVGTVVHRELQRVARDGGTLAVTDERAGWRWGHELAELGVPLELRRAAVERVGIALERTLADERGRWLLDSRHRSSATELALTGRIGPDVVRVVIDRTFIDADGVRWIVDYKSSRHEGADLEAFLDSEEERYRPQLERYGSLVRALGSEPTRLGLYFPMLSAWREFECRGGRDPG
ncbi:MAG: UvrD-helicase domain-containing protein [Steroidobacteraceae bacterium]|nr:UvrD-helicase domain-containing protein [Steroidobacteraceae bacterium]